MAYTEQYEAVEPMVDENGIYLPEPMIQRNGKAHTYRLVMTRDQFIKAYRLYILEDVFKIITDVMEDENGNLTRP